MLVRPILLKKLIDKVLGSQSWLSWEPETVERELSHADIPEVSYYKKDELFTNMLDAIRAISSEESMALMEWPLFENVCVTFSGNSPDFYETTPPAPYELYFAIRYLKDFFPDLLEELSDETEMYIGSLFITNGILCHLEPVINDCISTVIKHSNLDLLDDRLEQEKILQTLGRNEKLIKALSTSVTSGGADLDLDDKTSPESRRALQILVSYLFIENEIRNGPANLKEYLHALASAVPDGIVSNDDSVRASTTDEHVADMSDQDVDDLIDTLISSESASTGEMTPGDSLEVKEITDKVEKEAEALPGIAGMNYHSGQLYNVLNEVGHDDVPKSKLLSNDTKGSVILTGNTNSSFSNSGQALTVMGDKKPKEETNKINSPTDSSLELAEV